MNVGGGARAGVRDDVLVTDGERPRGTTTRDRRVLIASGLVVAFLGLASRELLADGAVDRFLGSATVLVGLVLALPSMIVEALRHARD